MKLELAGGHDSSPPDPARLKKFSSMLDTFEPYIRDFFEKNEGPFDFDAREGMVSCGVGTRNYTADEFLTDAKEFLTSSLRVIYIDSADGSKFSLRYNYGAQQGFELWPEEFYLERKFLR